MSPAPVTEETWCLPLPLPDSRKAVGKEDPTQSYPWSPSLEVTASRLFSSLQNAAFRWQEGQGNQAELHVCQQQGLAESSLRWWGSASLCKAP